MCIHGLGLAVFQFCTWWPYSPLFTWCDHEEREREHGHIINLVGIIAIQENKLVGINAAASL